MHTFFSIPPNYESDTIPLLRLPLSLHNDARSGMLEEGVYLAPSQFEAGFLSAAHTEEDIRATVSAAAEVLGLLGR